MDIEPVNEERIEIREVLGMDGILAATVLIDQQAIAEVAHFGNEPNCWDARIHPGEIEGLAHATLIERALSKLGGWIIQQAMIGKTAC